MKTLISVAAFVCAVLTALTTRMLIPAATIAYRYFEDNLVPQKPVIAGILPMSVAPLEAVATPVQQRHEPSSPTATSQAPTTSRKARRRRPSKSLLAKVEALA